MIKAVIDKIEDADEADRKHYKAGDGGKFYLDVTGLDEGTAHPAVGALVRAKKAASDESAARGAEAAKFKVEAEKAREDLHNRLKGKVEQSEYEALQKSYDQKLADATTNFTAQLTGRDSIIKDKFVVSEALSLATAIALNSDAAELLSESIQKRLTVEITTEGKAVTRVLGADGKPSAATIKDLKEEILATPKYAALLSGSKASGSGATPGAPGSGATGKVDWLRGSPAEVAAAAAKENPLIGG